MNSAVLFIVFKRYDTALEVFKCIRAAKPKRLYVAADAPRDNVKGEAEECRKTRDIIRLVDWDCEVKTLFQDENQGCGVGPYKAISWFFEHEEEGIVLEDDCCPHPDFFQYCEELLGKYRNDERVTLITGRNNFKTLETNGASYFLSALHFCWGWASWRRVWEKYDYTLAEISPIAYFKVLLKYFGWRNLSMVLWRMNIYYFCKKKRPRDIWDYQFCVSTQMGGGHTLVPKHNLVRNIGNDERATHTSGSVEDVPVMPVLPLCHPQQLHYYVTNDVLLSKGRYKKWKNVYYFIRNIIGL